MSPIEGWDERIAEAQLQREFVIRGRRFKRIPYGSERPPWRGATCGDCYVKRGQLHVVGCDIERCPACGGQAIMCPRLDEEEDEEW